MEPQQASWGEIFRDILRYSEMFWGEVRGRHCATAGGAAAAAVCAHAMSASMPRIVGRHRPEPPSIDDVGACLTNIEIASVACYQVEIEGDPYRARHLACLAGGGSSISHHASADDAVANAHACNAQWRARVRPSMS
eukprot:SAG31_NODE_1622_length_7722_cov_4.332940_1_plen_137_part_00